MLLITHTHTHTDTQMNSNKPIATGHRAGQQTAVSSQCDEIA